MGRARVKAEEEQGKKEREREKILKSRKENSNCVIVRSNTRGNSPNIIWWTGPIPG